MRRPLGGLWSLPPRPIEAQLNCFPEAVIRFGRNGRLFWHHLSREAKENVGTYERRGCCYCGWVAVGGGMGDLDTDIVSPLLLATFI